MCLNAVPPRLELNAKMQKGLTVKAGAMVLLEAEVFGKPMPKVTWKRGDDSLKSAEGQVISHQRHQFQLEMMGVTKEHTGTYTIHAENASGSKTADIEVKVLGAYSHILFYSVDKKCLGFLCNVIPDKDLTFFQHKYRFKSSVMLTSSQKKMKMK